MAWLLLIAILGALGGAIIFGPVFCCVVLSAILILCALARIFVPSGQIDFLVNRSKTFDVSVTLVLAVLATSLVLLLPEA